MSLQGPCALLSVSDKTGLLPFARTLDEAGWTLISTGGTRRHLEKGGLEVTPVSEVTDFPEMFDGRVKTLHPLIHGGLLARRGHEGDRAEMETGPPSPVAERRPVEPDALSGVDARLPVKRKVVQKLIIDDLGYQPRSHNAFGESSLRHRSNGYSLFFKLAPIFGTYNFPDKKPARIIFQLLGNFLTDLFHPGGFLTRFQNFLLPG